MDKLLSLSHLNTPLTPKRKKSGRSEKNEKQSRFIRLLNKENESSGAIGSIGAALTGDETIEELLDDLTSAGDSLKDDPGLSSLTEYRNCVKLFISFVLENGLTSEKQAGIMNPRTMEQKQYTIIRIVDEKMEKLAAHVLGSQQEQLEILRKVEQINGLLVDLLH